MARKANPTVVGMLPCGTCRDIMEVRERSNGRRLLYTWCPNCKMDQRSGKEIQAFWRDQMRPVGTSTESIPAKSTDVATELTEWTPDKPNNPQAPPNPPQDKTESTSLFGWLIGGVVTVGLVMLGINQTASKS